MNRELIDKLRAIPTGRCTDLEACNQAADELERQAVQREKDLAAYAEGERFRHRLLHGIESHENPGSNPPTPEGDKPSPPPNPPSPTGRVPDVWMESGNAALTHISNALEDLESSPDQRPVGPLREAMHYVRAMLAAAPPAPTVKQRRYYTVKPGDTLRSIAGAQYAEQLCAFNFPMVKPHGHVYPGQVLEVPLLVDAAIASGEREEGE